MILLMKKETRLNLRITPEFRVEIEQLAEYHGLTLSSYAHSVLVKAIRRERQELAGELPNVNQSKQTVNSFPIAPTSKTRFDIPKVARRLFIGIRGTLLGRKV
jgi:hypothetical protein